MIMNRSKGRKPFFILFILVLVFALTWGVMAIWNALLPELFGFKTISFWQALGLFALSRLLFGGFGLGGGRRPHFSGQSFKDKWINMSSEDRTHLKEEWKKRCERKDN